MPLFLSDERKPEKLFPYQHPKKRRGGGRGGGRNVSSGFAGGFRRYVLSLRGRLVEVDILEKGGLC